jgi:hypothetical protein
MIWISWENLETGVTTLEHPEECILITGTDKDMDRDGAVTVHIRYYPCKRAPQRGIS